MLIATVVPYAEAITGALVLVLCLRMLMLYRAFVVEKRGPAGAPARVQVQVQARQMAPHAILEDYIGELLGADDVINSLPVRREHDAVDSLEKKTSIQREARVTLPFDSHSYQPITAFLSSRCEAQQTV